MHMVVIPINAGIFFLGSSTKYLHLYQITYIILQLITFIIKT